LALHQCYRLFGAGAARGALAAALVLEEAEQVRGRCLEVVLVGEDDDGMAADEAAEMLELAADAGTVGRTLAPLERRGTYPRSNA